MSFEDDFWKGFRAIAKARGLTVSELLAIVESDRQQTICHQPFAFFVPGFYRDRISNQSADDGSVGWAGLRRSPAPDAAATHLKRKHPLGDACTDLRELPGGVMMSYPVI